MKIHFDNVIFSGSGSQTGPNTFANRLAKKLFELGHEVVFERQDAPISLVFIEPSGAPLAPKVVQRLDGIWSKPNEFENRNVSIKALYHKADAVVWQSKFDRNMTLRHWGFPAGSERFRGCVLEPMPDRVIGNGIEINPVKEITIPKLLEMRATYDQIYVCSSNWHPQKRLETNVKLFEHLRKQHPNSCLIIMGDHPDYRATGANVFYTGPVGPDVYMQVYSIANWMLHCAWSDHCPNVVCEALSQGCPVVCSEVGGTKELIGGYGVVLKEVEPYDYELYDYDHPPFINVEQVSDLPTRQELDYTGIADLIDINVIVKQYVERFEKVCK